MKLFISALVLFFTMAMFAPTAFVFVGQTFDSYRCAIGMDRYCNRSYDLFLEK